MNSIDCRRTSNAWPETSFKFGSAIRFIHHCNSNRLAEMFGPFALEITIAP